MKKTIIVTIAGMFIGLVIGMYLLMLIGAQSSDWNIIVWITIIAGGVLFYKLATRSTVPKSNYPPMPVFPYNTGGTHGTANWENPEYIDAIFNDGKFVECWIDGPGYYIGAGHNIAPLVHGVTIAGAGQGKNTVLIEGNLLKTPSASWFVTDIKGENAKITAGWQQQCGQRVIILDPWNEQGRLKATHGIQPMNFNPLQFVKSNPDELPELCGVIAEMLVPDNPNTKDEYWTSRARSLIKTYLLHLITARPEDEHHLGTLYRWLRLPGRERQRLWFEMEENSACDDLVKAGIGEFIGLSDDAGPLPSIVSTAQDNTEFLQSAALRNSLMGDGFDPYDLTDGKTTVYLCLPERFIKSHARWLRLVVGVCLKACNYRPSKRVNFLLDEFAILGKMAEVERAFAFGRGQNISCWIFVQSMTQLIDNYGENGANTLLANARLRQFFGIFDLPTQKYLSEYLGDTTISTTTVSRGKTIGHSSGTSSGGAGGGSSSGSNQSITESTNHQSISRRLLTVDEIGKMHDIITVIDGHKFLLARIPYWGSIYEAFRNGQYRYYPLTEKAWHNFIDILQDMAPEDRFDLNTVFLPRAFKGTDHALPFDPPGAEPVNPHEPKGPILPQIQKAVSLNSDPAMK